MGKRKRKPNTCPLCRKRLELKYINLETSLYFCVDLKCPYPVGYNCKIVKRTLDDSYRNSIHKAKTQIKQRKCNKKIDIELDSLTKDSVNNAVKQSDNTLVSQNLKFQHVMNNDLITKDVVQENKNEALHELRSFIIGGSRRSKFTGLSRKSILRNPTPTNNEVETTSSIAQSETEFSKLSTNNAVENSLSMAQAKTKLRLSRKSKLKNPTPTNDAVETDRSKAQAETKEPKTRYDLNNEVCVDISKVNNIIPVDINQTVDNNTLNASSSNNCLITTDDSLLLDGYTDKFISDTIDELLNSSTNVTSTVGERETTSDFDLDIFKMFDEM